MHNSPVYTPSVMCSHCGSQIKVVEGEIVWADGWCTSCTMGLLQTCINDAQRAHLPLIEVEEIEPEQIECLHMSSSTT